MQKYCNFKFLGNGSHGYTQLVEEKSTGSLWVMKIVDLPLMSSEMQEKARQESEILKKLNHPNIVSYHDSFLDGGESLCTVMQYANGGDLQGLIDAGKASGKPLDESQVLAIFLQLCEGLKHCHEHKVLHRDIKPDNIFLTRTEGEDGTEGEIIPMLGDFGISRTLAHTRELAKTLICSPVYVSPEFCLDEGYGTPSDVWALGVSLYQMLTYSMPFGLTGQDGTGRGGHHYAVFNQIINEPYNPLGSHVSLYARSLVRALLDKDPARRPTAGQLVERLSSSSRHANPNPLLRMSVDTRVGKLHASLMEREKKYHSDVASPVPGIPADRGAKEQTEHTSLEKTPDTTPQISAISEPSSEAEDVPIAPPTPVHTPAPAPPAPQTLHAARDQLRQVTEALCTLQAQLDAQTEELGTLRSRLLRSEERTDSLLEQNKVLISSVVSLQTSQMELLRSIHSQVTSTPK
eukprot:gnl/Dysnectes_brevis/6738_a10682_321.p1 GENE.gnl/Dysnectes_brevis/6738_a10682_321~~gnl/Dysnectes_brevis/6738_a10682_321.p1  ORF type:complete len:480 (+),score=91.70 gnl/Dysnectes_brevis/6738_a10682_321:57-1442(+)